MRIVGKRFFLLLVISVLSVNLIFCSKKEEKPVKKDVVQKVKEKKQEKNTSAKSEEEMTYGIGINKKFTTDGKLHEEKLLNKNFGYPDTADSFKIEKDSKGYFITEYIDESPILGEDVPVKEKKSRLKLENNVYLIDDSGLAYAYDTNLKKVVLLNKENNFRIIFIINE
ncbi:pantothenate kinase [Leptotrichia sp. oral taxon 221]|uniref:pantothenate kinase n=1 Tax=Leptotrichia sp. oral taxon 221 TaxID=712362 RepID=UPI001B8B84BF|nr:pantothenate kinase [Leptotrichia sp. oral taxon 221]QUB96422.1 pantothenate kinase [Leptotrichia sp. oral taxon 221]